MTDLTRAELARLAERRIWRVLLDADQFADMPISLVRARAQHRLDFLDGQLAHRLDINEDVLSELPSEVSDLAYGDGDAALEMGSTL